MNATPWPSSWSRQEGRPLPGQRTFWTSSPPTSTRESLSSWAPLTMCKSIFPSTRSITNEVLTPLPTLRKPWSRHRRDHRHIAQISFLASLFFVRFPPVVITHVKADKTTKIQSICFVVTQSLGCTDKETKPFPLVLQFAVLREVTLYFFK